MKTYIIQTVDNAKQLASISKLPFSVRIFTGTRSGSYRRTLNVSTRELPKRLTEIEKTDTMFVVKQFKDDETAKQYVKDLQDYLNQA